MFDWPQCRTQQWRQRLAKKARRELAIETLRAKYSYVPTHDAELPESRTASELIVWVMRLPELPGWAACERLGGHDREARRMWLEALAGRALSDDECARYELTL